MAELYVLMFKTDQRIHLRMDGQSAQSIPIAAGGMVLLFDIDADAGAATNATINNNTGNETTSATANIEGFAGGT